MTKPATDTRRQWNRMAASFFFNSHFKHYTNAMSEQSDIKDEALDTILPLEILDKSIGKEIQVLMSNDKEFHGTLIGFDDFVNMVLENVKEIDGTTSSGKVIKKMLLNGGQISMLVPKI